MFKLFLKIFFSISFIKFFICLEGLSTIKYTYIIQLFFINLILAIVLVKRYRDKKFKVNSSFLVTLSFVVFFYLLNELVFLNELLILNRKWNLDSEVIHDNLTWYNWYFLLYFLLFQLGLDIRFRRITINWKRVKMNPLLVGYVFLFFGIIGSILSVGGLDEYLSIIGKFYLRSDSYINTVESLDSSITLILVLRSFLIPGALILFYVWNGSETDINFFKVITLFLILLFFGGVTGQRSVFLGFIIYVYLWKYFKSGQIFNLKNFSFFILFFFLSTLFAVLRDKQFLDFTLIKGLWKYALIHSGSTYLTNFSGIYTLIEYYSNFSFFKLDTIINQFSGIFGGPTPLTTEQFMWRELSSDNSSVPRYGMWFEFFLNYGYMSLAFALVHGSIIGLIARTIRLTGSSVFSVVYNSLILYLIIVLSFANWSYIPRQFAFLSFPIIILYFLSSIERSEN